MMRWYFHNVARPNARSRSEVKAVEQGRCAKGEDTVAYYGWRRTRAFASHCRIELRRVRMNPEFFARFERARHDTFLIAALLLRQTNVAHHHEARPTRADFFAPDNLGRMRNPVCFEPWPRQNTITVRAVELGEG